MIASASFDKTIKIWEWKSGSLVASLEGHTDIVRSLELLEESGLLISTSDDKSIKGWKLIWLLFIYNMYKQYSSSNSQFKSNMMHSSVGKMDMQESIQCK